MAVISSQPNNIQSKLFYKSRSSTLGFIIPLVISFILVIADYHYQCVGTLRSGFSVFVSPLQYIVDYPIRIVEAACSLISSKKKLINENMQLRYQQTMLEAQLQKLMVMSNENSQLKELLSATPSAQMRAMAAHILAVDTTSSRQILVINKGKRDGVLMGQTVLDAKGLMGQIIDVGWMTSTVLLISDSKSAVPVRNDRTGERAILEGINKINQLSLINLPRTSSIAKGDLLVTSGLGRRYPEGYPVGVVEFIKNIPGDDFIKVIVKPIALLNRSRLVLVIWPEEDHALITDQINERMCMMDKNA